MNLPKDLLKIIEGYTRESGVRSLERQIGSVSRNIAKSIAMEEDYSKTVNEEKVIEASIKSCLDIKKKYEARIILIDSLSTDNTINIAKNYPIEIYQINDINLRSYGIAGYFAGKICENDDYVLLIDDSAWPEIAYETDTMYPENQVQPRTYLIF